MIRKSAAFIAMLLTFASCGKRQDPPVSDSESKTAPRIRHAVRPASSVSGARGQLRSAFENAKLMEPGEERDKTITEIAWNSLESAPDLAADAIRELPAGNEGKMALIDAYLRMLLAEEKSDDATAWADSLGHERDVAYAREKINLLLLEAHPERLPASSFTAAGTDPAAIQVLQNWVFQKPADAIAWATRLPAGEARTTGFKIIFSQWLGNDAASALSWVKTQKNPQFRKEAISALIGALSDDSDPIRYSLRNSSLEPADPALRAEIEQGIAEIARQRETAEPEPEPEEPAPESETEHQPSE